MPLTRTTHWATREFDAHLRTTRRAAFEWGQNDCCMFPANAILAYTGTDIADDFRGKYHDQDSAFALIHSVTGGSTVEDAAAWCATKHGLVEYKHPLCAQRGDLGLVRQKVPNQQDRIIAGIIHLSGHFVSIGETGQVRFPITAVYRAWKV